MSDVWSYLSGSRRRARSKASLDQQSSCCISDTTAPGSPSHGLDESGSLKLGSLAATSGGRGSVSTTGGGGSASLDHAGLLSPSTAPSVAASSSLFSPATTRTDLPPASLRTSASLRDSYASSSWVASPLGPADDGHGDTTTMPAAKMPRQHLVGPSADSDAASHASSQQQRQSEGVPVPQQSPMTSDIQPAPSQAASPLSEWGSYKTPSGSRQRTKDHGVGGDSPMRVANLSAWPVGSSAPEVLGTSSHGMRSTPTGHRRTSSSQQPGPVHANSAAAAADRGRATADATAQRATNPRRGSLASLRSALSSRRGSPRGAPTRSTGPVTAQAAGGADGGNVASLQSPRRSAGGGGTHISGKEQHGMVDMPI